MESIFTVTPMNQRISLSPGETYTGYITVINPASATADFNYKASVSPYGVVGRDYEADLLTITNRSQIANWITIKEPTGTIAPNEAKQIEFTITVPESAPAGGQYATILVSSDNNTTTSGGLAVENVFEMASIIYASVAGETVHAGEILENEVPGFSATTPVVVSALLNNTGNVHEGATFVLTVSNFLTGEVILPTEENDGRYYETIMPETERYVTREISNLPMIGVVKVNQTIYYNGVASTTEKDVLICPIWFILLVFATIAALITVVTRMILKHKRKKRLI